MSFGKKNLLNVPFPDEPVRLPQRSSSYRVGRDILAALLYDGFMMVII